MTLPDRFQKYVVDQRDEKRFFCRSARNDRYTLYIPMIYPDGVSCLITNLQATVVPGSPAAAQAVWNVFEEVFVRSGLGGQFLALEDLLGDSMVAALTAQSSKLQIEDDVDKSPVVIDDIPEGEAEPEGDVEPEDNTLGVVNPAAAAIAVASATDGVT